MPISSPRVCPILVGRNIERDALVRLLEETANGHGRLVLVCGEAGVGKTRLVRELLPYADGLGFHLLIGGCADRDRDFPFGPFVDALRQRLAESLDEPQAFLGSEGEVLAELLPEVRRFLPGSALRDLAPEQAKRHQFEAVVSLLSRLATERPLLLILEDLHWADPTSLELLELLPRRLAATRILIVATARPEEPDSDFSRCLAALRRMRLPVELSLAPLSVPDMARMLEALLPAPPSPALVAAVHARTDGNPFFLEELLATAPTGARIEWLLGEPAVPQTVRDAVLRRLAKLGQRERAVVNLASVAGPHLSMGLLGAASGLPEDELTAALEILIDRQVLVEERTAGRTRLAFRHALTRDAVHDRLLLPQRRVLHRAVGEALEASVGSIAVTPGDLGYHFHAAGEWAKALTYATQAADAARRVHATMEALIHERRALDAALALSPDHPQAADLHRRCGHGLALLGEFDPARKHLEEALRLARQRAADYFEAAVLYDLAGLYASRDYREAERLTGVALARARVCGDRRLEGLALNRLGNVVTNLTRFAEGRALHEGALALFETLGDRWGSADSLDLIGMTHYLGGNVSEARMAFGRAAAIFTELGDTERTASALTSRGLYLAVLDGPCATRVGPHAFRIDAEEGLRLCRELGWRAGEAYARVALACADLGDGQYGEARHHVESALAIAAEIEHPQWSVIALLTLGLLHVDLLDDAQAWERFEHALDLARTIGSAQWMERLEVWMARCHARLGDPDAASVVLHALLPRESQPTTIGQRRAIFTLAELELARRQPDNALTLVDRLLPAAVPHAAAVVLLRAEILAAQGETDEADAELQEARALAVACGPRSLRWRVAAARARLWRQWNPALADQEATLARTEVAALAAAVPDEQWRAAFLRAPEVQPWIAPAGRRRTSDTAHPGGLTPREWEVAAQVAAGLSNKEIARALSVADKTFEMHVSSCLGKLGFASRAQLAAWAVGQGIAPPTPQ